MTKYDDHKAKRQQWMKGAEAEYHGFCSAQFATRCLECYSHDPYIQQRFTQGYEEGIMCLLEAAHEHHAVRTLPEQLGP